MKKKAAKKAVRTTKPAEIELSPEQVTGTLMESASRLHRGIQEMPASQDSEHFRKAAEDAAANTIKFLDLVKAPAPAANE